MFVWIVHVHWDYINKVTNRLDNFMKVHVHWDYTDCGTTLQTLRNYMNSHAHKDYEYFVECYRPSWEWLERSCAWRDCWNGAGSRRRADPVEWRPPRRPLSTPRQWTGGSSRSGSAPSTPPTSAAYRPRGTPAWNTAGSTWKTRCSQAWLVTNYFYFVTLLE